MPLCRWCSRLTRHHTLFICDERIRYGSCLASEREGYDAAFLKACGITVADEPVAACGVITVEIVMQGESVRKAREMHAMRKRKPLLGERHAHGAVNWIWERFLEVARRVSHRGSVRRRRNSRRARGHRTGATRGELEQRFGPL